MINGGYILVSLFVFIFGTIIGSFLNVVALRFNTGLTIKGRSGCFSCGKTLSWKELIPVLSFLFQKGRCASCKSKISSQYPIVELLTGIIFLGIFFRVFPDLFISSSPLYFVLYTFYLTLIFSVLIVIGIYDMKHKIIPDSLVFTFIGLSFLNVLISSFSSLQLSPFHFLPAIASGFRFWQAGQLWTFLAGPILFLPFFLLWLVSKGKWIGFGDAKLALGIGWFLGLSGGTTALFLAFYSGAIVGLTIIFIQKILAKAGSSPFGLSFMKKTLTIKSEIPFGPFLILGLLVVFFFGVNFFTFYGPLF